MIALRIYNGETAEQIGIPEGQYRSRKETLDRFLAQWGGEDFKADYRAWLKTQDEGQAGGGGASSTDTAPEPKESCCGQKKVEATKTEMVKEAGKAAMKHAASGFKNVDDEQYQRRRDICEMCPHLVQGEKESGDGDRCGVCGCFMKVKARWRTTNCPKGLWEI